MNSHTVLWLNFGGFPILLSSRLQSKINLSTLEAEYIVLSQEIRELVAEKNVLAELGTQMNFYLNIISKVSYTLEDKFCFIRRKPS